MKIILKLIIAAILISLLIWYAGGLTEIMNSFSKANISYLFIAFIVMTIDRLLMAYKWGILLGKNKSKLPLLRNCQIYCTSMVWGLFLPMTVGTDAVRATLVSKQGIDAHSVVASIVIERLVGFVASLLFGIAGLVILRTTNYIDSNYNYIFIAAAILMIMSLAIIYTSFNPKAHRLLIKMAPQRILNSKFFSTIEKFQTTYLEYRLMHKEVSLFFILTLFEQFVSILFSWFIILSLDLDISLWLITAVIPLTMLVSRLPISFDGIGVTEGVLIGLMSLFSIAPADTLAFAFLARITQTSVWMSWWLSYAFKNKKAGPPNTDNAI